MKENKLFVEISSDGRLDAVYAPADSDFNVIVMDHGDEETMDEIEEKEKYIKEHGYKAIY